MKKIYYELISGALIIWKSKLLKRMRIATLLILITMTQTLALDSYAQSKRLSLNFKNEKIITILKEIEDQSEFYFMFDASKIDVTQRKSIDCENRTITSILDQLFENTGITYRIGDRQIGLISTEFADAEQQHRVSGKVTDTNGQPLPGVTVVVKKTTQGTVTNTDGNYFLTNITDGVILQFSFVGMKIQEIEVGHQTSINVVMEDETIGIEEVVAIGYGVQKKENLTGAVQQISSVELENRPLINVGQSLQGLIPNLNIGISSGQANAIPSFNIRGMESISGGDPLIIIDGVPASKEEFMAINTNDIAGISALMDAASSAIYGARAAFGVVLVTTKNAENDDIKVSVNSNIAFRRPTVVPEFIFEQNIVMQARVTATGGWYTLKDIYGIDDWDYLDKVTNGEADQVTLNPEDPTKWMYAGRTNWYKEAMKDGITQNHSVSISGKAKKTRYYFSGGYSRQEGVFKYGNDIFDKYNFRGKIDFDLTEWFTLSNNTSYNYDYYDEPSQGFNLSGLLNTPTLDVIKNPDGSWTSSGASIFGATTEGGRSYTRTSRYWTSFTGNARFFKDLLRITAKTTFMRSNQGVKAYWLPIEYKTGPELVEYYHSTSEAQRDASSDRQNVFDLYADIDKTFGIHHFHVLIGYNQEYRYNDWFSAYRKDLISTSIPSIDLATGDREVEESVTDWSTRSGFFRFNYDLSGSKYLIEVNGRYDGTSRFPTNDRFGFFPSFSLGWNLAKENFMSFSTNILSVLKPRFSYGILGNQDVGAYAYLPTMSSGKTSSILDGTGGLDQQTTIYSPGLVASSLTWEKVKTTNYGLDFGFFKNQFTGTFDYYHRAVLDMLTQSKELPDVLGTSEPQENAADLITKGWELTLSWKNNFKLAGSVFNYKLGLNLADSRAWITKFDNPEGNLSDYYAGYEIGTIWGFVSNGLFQSEEELQQHANQSSFWTYPGKVSPGPGDIKFEDLNGDGQIKTANTIYDLQDQKIIGNSQARYHIGFTSAFNWKNFDFNMFIQGVLKQDWYPGSSYNFWGLNAGPWTNLQKYQYENSWTTEHTDAYLPRIKGYAATYWSGAEMLQANTRYLQNSAYLRLKSISIGYSIPENLISKVKLQQLRIYATGENLLTWTGIKNPYIDPEASLNGYPLQKIFSFGINAKF